MNVKYLLEFLLIASGVFYYYVAALFPDNVQQVLSYTAAAGATLAGLIIIRHTLSRSVSKNSLIFIALFLVTFVISYLMSWSNIIWVALMSVPLLRISKDVYIKNIFFTSLTLFTATVCLSIWGPLTLEYINFAGEIEERYGSVKYSLGFDGPNQAAFAFFTVLLSGLYSYGKNKAFVLLISVMTLAVGIATGSRTGLICSVLFIVFYLYLTSRAGNKKAKIKTSKVLPHLFVILAFISIIVATLFKDNVQVNELLSGRPETIGYYLSSDYIPRPLGSNEVYNKAEFQTPPLDNFPVYILGKYGVVGFLLVAVLFYVSLRSEKSQRIKILFTFIMIYGITEAFFDIPAKNFLLPIFFYSAMFKQERGVS